ncbi:MAG: hypothetical protein K0R13_3217 [Propionibacteriaceae bacterium]|nr:hypothetical protein [Propionibacteriaceae bacterium]
MTTLQPHVGSTKDQQTPTSGPPLGLDDAADSMPMATASAIQGANRKSTFADQHPIQDQGRKPRKNPDVSC